MKTGACTGVHYRVYADGDDRMFNSTWGYYLLSTTHIDQNECGSSPTYGWSEDASNHVANAAAAAWGASRVHRNAVSLGNGFIAYWKGNHYMQNDGYAHYIDVP